MLGPRSLAQALGGDVCGSNAVLAPGPGHSRTDRSLSVKIDPQAPGGFIVYSHAGDDPIVCRDYIRERCGLGRWNNDERHRSGRVVSFRPVSRDTEAERKQALALELWSRSTSPIGTIVERYLASRALQLTDDVAGSVLRFHPALHYQGQSVPAMLALLRDIDNDEPCGVHRTFLTADGRKLDRKMLGRAGGAAIKLDNNENVTLGLTIGEGVETVLAARQIGFRPAWALGSVGAISTFTLLDGIESLTVLEEAGNASVQAVRRCGRVWAGAGKEVIVITPKTGSDVNDALRGVG